MRSFEYIKSLGSELEKVTRDKKHSFDEKWISGLIEFYKENEGKSLIHLSDITDNLFVKLDSKGQGVLLKMLASKNMKGNSKRAIRRYLKLKDKFISLRNLKGLLGKKINLIERHLQELKTTKSGIGKSLKNPKFPIDLKTECGAVLLGCYPDVTIKTGEFVSKEEEMFSDIKKYFNTYIGEVKPTYWKTSVYHMQLSPIIKILYRIAGLNNRDRQIITNNGLPHWTFFSPRNFQRLLLRKLWDAEGSAPVDKKMCLGQSVALHGVSEYVPIYPERKSFTKFRDKRKILGTPPNLLVSTQLILYRFGILSSIKPHRLYTKKNGLVVCDWHLLISGYPNLNNFYAEIGFGLKRKQGKLEECLESYNRNYPKNKSLRGEEIMNLIRNMETFTILDIQGKLDLSTGTVRNYLTRLRKRKEIEKIRTISRKNGPSFVNEYMIIRGDHSGMRIGTR